MTTPFDTIGVKCQSCGKAFSIPAGKRKRAIRLGHSVADFCSIKCNRKFVADNGKLAQKQAHEHSSDHRSGVEQPVSPSRGLSSVDQRKHDD